MAVQEACLDTPPILLLLEGTHFFVRLAPFETTLQETPSRMLVPRESSLNLFDHRFSVQAFQHISKSALQLLFARAFLEKDEPFAERAFSTSAFQQVSIALAEVLRACKEVQPLCKLL